MVKRTRFVTCSFAIVRVDDLINYCKIHTINPTNTLILTLCFLHIICQNSDVFHCVLIILGKITEHYRSVYK